MRSTASRALAVVVIFACLGIHASECPPPPPPPSGKPDSLAHPSNLYHVSNPLEIPVGPDPVIDPDSPSYVAALVTATGTAGFAMMLNQFAIPVYYADASTPRYNVTLDVYDGLPPTGYCGKKFMSNAPIPSWVAADPGSDGVAIVVDSSTGCTYEFWGYDKKTVYTTPNAYFASAILNASDGIYHDGISAGPASNITTLNGVLWPDEVASPAGIPHALALGINGSMVRANQPVPPATHADGAGMTGFTIPEGAHLQLDPALDLDSLGLLPYQKAIAKALQVYGGYVALATNGPVDLYAISPLSSNNNPWVGIVPDPTAAYASLPTSLLSRMRVLELPPTTTNLNKCAIPSPCGTYQ